MDRSAGPIFKRRRSADQEHGSRPSRYQPTSPTWLSETTNSDAMEMDDLTTSGSADTLLPDRAGEPARLLLLDQDAHLLEFGDTPPAGGGGSCELYIAVHKPTNMKLAMKRLRVNFPSEDMLRRFRREAEIWAGFRHPNILPFFGSMQIRHRIYIVSPWRQFGDLLAFIQTRIKAIREGKWFSDLSIPPTCRGFTETRAIREIAAGLEYLHAISVVHGDMKAKNVLLTDEGQAQICDFGLTKTLDHSVTSTELKGVGSIRWQGPELLDDVPKSPESDVYAFGMTISEILTGNYPFPHLKENTAVIFAVMLRNERPECQPHSFLEVDFEPLWRIAASCWEAKPEDRPRIKEVLQRLTPPPTRAIQRLTHDILQHIFIYTCNSSSWGWRWPPHNLSLGTALAITLSHVCQSWRLAATKSPSLWLDLQFNGSFPFNLQSLQIERSDEAGITIEIEGEYNTEETNQLIRLLRPHVTQWKSLKMESLYFKSDSFRLFFDELRHECAPMLETLRVHGYDGSNWEWESQPFSRGTPRLVDLQIGHYQLYRHARLFSHLTDLYIAPDHCAESCEVHPLYPQDLLAIFAQCASTIRSVDIWIPDCTHMEGSNPLLNPISLPHLTKLNLNDNEELDNIGSFISKIYSQITAPKIQSRILGVSELERLASPAAFPFPNLTCLEIHDRSDELLVDNLQLVFRRIFDQLPQLRELKVQNVADFDLRILESTCMGLQKFSWRWFHRSQPGMEYSLIKDVIERRQLCARERGMKDSLVQVRCWSEDFKPSEEDLEWLESHLELFEFSFFV